MSIFREILIKLRIISGPDAKPIIPQVHKPSDTQITHFLDGVIHTEPDTEPGTKLNTESEEETKDRSDRSKSSLKKPK